MEDNWNAVQVFIRCKQGWAIGMSSASAMGFSAQEVEAGCRLAGIDVAAWPVVSEQVHDMGRIAAEELNKRKP